jgi:hypothetical protein
MGDANISAVAATSISAGVVMNPTTTSGGISVGITGYWSEPELLRYAFVPTTSPAESANNFRLKFSRSSKTDGMVLYGFSILERERRVR